MQVETSVVYGMISGLALLMDVYRPDAPNGLGLIHISGSGWTAPLGLDARPLKESAHVQIEGRPLLEAGYTLFTINHRATPRFAYPDPVLDAQRAVRWHGDSLARRDVRLQHDVAAGLVDLAIAPAATQRLDQRGTAQVARQSHEAAITSSLTR